MIVAARCVDCGGDCAPECGMHPMGCLYGGFTEATSYWIAVVGCPLDHGDSAGTLAPDGDEMGSAPTTIHTSDAP